MRTKKKPSKPPKTSTTSEATPPTGHPACQANAFPRACLCAFALRTLAATIALTGVIALLQALRAQSLLAHASHHLPLWVALLRAAIPALLTVTLPIALLVAAALTYGEAAENREVLAWNAIGRRRRSLLVGPMALAGALTLFMAANLAWWSPRGLDQADLNLAELLALGAVAQLHPHQGHPLGPTLTAWGQRQDDRPAHIDHLTLLFNHGQASLRLQAEHLHLETNRDGLAQLHFDRIQVQTRHANDPTCTYLQAQRADLSLQLTSAQQRARLLPPVERLDLGALLAAHQQGDAIATGHIVKRLTLAALSPLLLALLLAAILSTQAMASPHRALIFALLLAAAAHGLVRSAEILARKNFAAGLSLTACAGLALMATTALLLLRQRLCPRRRR